MAISLQDAHERIQKFTAKLNEQLASRDADHIQLVATLSDYRRACTSALNADYPDAARWKLEETLWDMHSKVNNRFRRDIMTLKRKGQNNAVEIRKLTKPCLDFLKSSQRFYRTYICELDMQHGGIPELRKVARKMESQQAVAGLARAPSPSEDSRKKLVLSCYTSLIHLGDLSRYRETECSSEPPKWGPAVGYYNLAIEIYPYSGVSYNQLAIIALADSRHLRAMYYLYRSLTVQEPHPLGQNNLEIEFKKITTAWDNGELIKNGQSRDGNGSNKVLIAWFVRLHSRCYQGVEFAGHRELEDEVLGQLTREIKDHAQHSNDQLLSRMVLINIAAEWFVTKREKGDQARDVRSYQFYVQLNVRTFTTLLQILLDELEQTSSNASDEVSTESTNAISVIARRVLPAVRVYSFWLAANTSILGSEMAEPYLQQRLQEMWRVYAKVLTFGVTTFVNQEAITADYLFEEDADIIGFLPLVTERTKKLWYSNGELRPRFSDEGVAKHVPAKEALIRLRDFLLDGIVLTSEKKSPLVYENLLFSYQVDYDLKKTLGAATENSPQRRKLDLEPVIAAQVPAAPSPTAKSTAPPAQASQPARRTTADTISTSVTKDSMMNQMVDALVDEDDNLDPIPEGDQALPLTPPLNYDHAPMVRDPSNNAAPLTASVFVQRVQNWGLPQPPSPYTRHGASMSPSMKNAYSPGQQADMWAHPAAHSGPTSPWNTTAQHSTASPMMGTASHMPLHSRGQSIPALQPLRTDVFGGTLSSTRPSTAHILTPTYPRSNEIEEMRDVWGVTPNVPTAEWVRRQQPRYEDQGNTMTSSALFGPGGGPWSAGMGRSSSSHGNGNGWTPAHGQGTSMWRSISSYGNGIYRGNLWTPPNGQGG